MVGRCNRGYTGGRGDGDEEERKVRTVGWGTVMRSLLGRRGCGYANLGRCVVMLNLRIRGCVTAPNRALVAEFRDI